MAQNSPVVVGVDGSAASTNAVRVGAREAARVGVDLHLVHVLPSYVPVAPMAPLVRMDLEDTGRAIVTAAERVAREQGASTVVTSSLLEGPRIAALVKAAENARVLVLGHVQGPSIDRLVTGATVSAVAARATCPVVAVPADYSVGHEHDRVLVGIKSTEHSQHLLRRGFELATERHAKLLLVHAWELGHEYDDIITARVDTGGWESRARDALEQDVAPLRAEFAQVPVEIRVVHGQPARVLRDASAEADVLLMARRRRAFPVGRIGGTARALLRHGACPVVVEPSAEEPEASAELELELEEAGLLQK